MCMDTLLQQSPCVNLFEFARLQGGEASKRIKCTCSHISPLICLCMRAYNNITNDDNMIIYIYI